MSERVLNIWLIQPLSSINKEKTIFMEQINDSCMVFLGKSREIVDLKNKNKNNIH